MCAQSHVLYVGMCLNMSHVCHICAPWYVCMHMYAQMICIVCAPVRVSTYMFVRTGMHMYVQRATEPRLFFLPMESVTQALPASLSERVLPAYQAKTGAAGGISC